MTWISEKVGSATMKNKNMGTNNHKFWFYYTSGAVCTSIVFDFFCESIKHSLSYLRSKRGKLGLNTGRMDELGGNSYDVFISSP